MQITLFSLETFSSRVKLCFWSFLHIPIPLPLPSMNASILTLRYDIVWILIKASKTYIVINSNVENLLDAKTRLESLFRYIHVLGPVVLYQYSIITGVSRITCTKSKGTKMLVAPRQQLVENII